MGEVRRHPRFVPQYLYDRAIEAGIISADDPNWRPVKPIPILERHPHADQ